MTAPVILKLKVVPSSSRDRIVGWLGDSLKIKVAAPPEKGKANKAVISLLEKKLSTGKGSITLHSGDTSPNKTVAIDCDDGDIIMERLKQLI